MIVSKPNSMMLCHPSTDLSVIHLFISICPSIISLSSIVSHLSIYHLFINHLSSIIYLSIYICLTVCLLYVTYLYSFTWLAHSF